MRVYEKSAPYLLNAFYRKSGAFRVTLRKKDRGNIGVKQIHWHDSKGNSAAEKPSLPWPCINLSSPEQYRQVS
jgi:hypothetical protein